MNIAQEFESLYRAARSLNFRGFTSAAALVTITRTWGSTFRRAGASMLVRHDGSVVCELSGGCPQRDIVLRAQRAMESGEPALVAYGRDSNYDVMIETGCGGELEVLIEPWRQHEDLQFLNAIEKLRSERRLGAMASLFAVDGNVLTHRPLRLVRGDSSIWTNIDHAPLRKLVLADLAKQQPVSSAAMTGHVESTGQRYDVLLESLHPPHALVIVGDGMGAAVLARLSHELGWPTTLVSAHQPASQMPDGIRRVIATPHSLTSDVIFDEHTSAVVMTHVLEHDLGYIAPLMATPVRYIGVIGSRQRADRIRAVFPQAGDRLHVPAGLDVGSETPQEIAIAITAEILAIRNGRSGVSLNRLQTAIHP